ncbi:hypothetical protein EOE18_12330 [Novosphingobium umbonatum]|uniref:Uncharacterized protein n=1 Tax=Novosphingobium umbonatum TaxID=1908524 RepID=A0A437N2X7_9SPHN|nr:hypothetical protein [Novosphingobium umbonatum]RVU04276.1 hypothetical protein EOE18_12330 [Novosphingobium umbonatum]
MAGIAGNVNGQFQKKCIPPLCAPCPQAKRPPTQAKNTMSNPENTDKSTTSAPERPLSREERLAAKLRENLRRRKAQARALQNEGEGAQANQED